MKRKVEIWKVMYIASVIMFVVALLLDSWRGAFCCIVMLIVSLDTYSTDMIGLLSKRLSIMTDIYESFFKELGDIVKKSQDRADGSSPAS